MSVHRTVFHYVFFFMNPRTPEFKPLYSAAASDVFKGQDKGTLYEGLKGAVVNNSTRIPPVPNTHLRPHGPPGHFVCRLRLEKKKNKIDNTSGAIGTWVGLRYERMKDIPIHAIA